MVGGPLAVGLAPVAHSVPMLSIENLKVPKGQEAAGFDEIVAFDRRNHVRHDLGTWQHSAIGQWDRIGIAQSGRCSADNNGATGDQIRGHFAV